MDNDSSDHESAHEAERKFRTKTQATIYAAVVDALVDDDRKHARFINDAQTEQITTLTRKQRLKMEAKGEFPTRVPLAPRLDAYLEEEVENWIEKRLAQREEELSKRRSPNPLAKSNRQTLARDARRATKKKCNAAAAEDKQAASDKPDD